MGGDRGGRSGGAPLDGLRVVDFSRVLAGPYCSMLLADLGADVVKVERPATGDDTRAWGPPFRGEDATYSLSVNRNKRSVALDLTDPADLEVARRLVADADVLVENFRGGVMAGFGLDEPTVRATNPDLVYCSVTAYDHPDLADRPGYDLLMQAASGFMSITGHPDGPPVKVGVAVLDVVAGLFATVGVLAALTARGRGAPGQHVTVGLFDAAVAALVNQATAHLAGDVVPTRQGNAHPSIVPYQSFTAADGDLVIAAGNDKLFALTCVALGLPDLATDPRFRTNRDRVAHREVLVAALQDRIATGGVDGWLAELERLGVPASRVRAIDEVFASPEGQHATLTVEDPVRGPLRLVRTPIGLSATPLRTDHRPPPLLDEHGEAVRAAVAGPTTPTTPTGPTAPTRE